MLLTAEFLRIDGRSGMELDVSDMGIARRTLESSEEIDRLERTTAPKRGGRTYSLVDMMMIVLLMEIKHKTMGGIVADLRGTGGQEKLEALGMPCRDGVYLCPCKSRISDFINHVWPRMADAVIGEIAGAMLERMGRAGSMTFDSTPLEASRYSKRHEYSPHYEIRMDKCNILMAEGHPLAFTRTGANDGDNPEMLKVLRSVDMPLETAEFLTDGAYRSYESYVEVFVKTGRVMATNQGVNAAFHADVTWKRVLDRYARYHGRSDFSPPKGMRPRDILLYLVKRGEREFVGKFLHNLDFRRGAALKAEMARRRHSCETLHFCAKRWLRFDVRGLRKEGEDQRVKMRFFIVQLLTTVFRDPESI